MFGSVNSIKPLKSKVDKLLRSYRGLSEKSRRLEESNKSLMEELSNAKKKISELEEKIKVEKMALAFSGDDQNTRELKLKINEYIKDIDRCLALINR
jgi:predicted RNase H-like nuclease (RuvC/YqgF family)